MPHWLRRRRTGAACRNPPRFGWPSPASRSTGWWPLCWPGSRPGELNPGEQLRQEDLAEELGVSRVPVREALHALAEQRVLVHQKHRGFFVAKRNAHEVAQFARMLELIEDDLLASIRWPTAEEAHPAARAQ